jgi:hypothetical protein
MRGPRTNPASAIATFPAPSLPLPNQMTHPANPNFVQSNLSFRHHLSPSKIASSSKQVTINSAENDPNTEIPQPPPSLTNNPSPEVDPTPFTPGGSSTVLGQDHDRTPTGVSPKIPVGRLPSPTSPSTSGIGPIRTTKPRPKSRPKSKPPHSPSATTPSSTYAHQQNVGSPQSDAFTASATSFSNPDTPTNSRVFSRVGSFGTGGGGYAPPSTTLTYDSFWSSHASTSAGAVVASTSRAVEG